MGRVVLFLVSVLDFGQIFHKCAISLHHSIQFSVQQCRAAALLHKAPLASQGDGKVVSVCI